MGRQQGSVVVHGRRPPPAGCPARSRGNCSFRRRRPPARASRTTTGARRLRTSWNRRTAKSSRRSPPGSAAGTTFSWPATASSTTRTTAIRRESGSTASSPSGWTGTTSGIAAATTPGRPARPLTSCWRFAPGRGPFQMTATSPGGCTRRSGSPNTGPSTPPAPGAGGCTAIGSPTAGTRRLRSPPKVTAVSGIQPDAGSRSGPGERPPAAP